MPGRGGILGLPDWGHSSAGRALAEGRHLGHPGGRVLGRHRTQRGGQEYCLQAAAGAAGGGWRHRREAHQGARHPHGPLRPGPGARDAGKRPGRGAGGLRRCGAAPARDAGTGTPDGRGQQGPDRGHGSIPESDRGLRTPRWIHHSRPGREHPPGPGLQRPGFRTAGGDPVGRPEEPRDAGQGHPPGPGPAAAGRAHQPPGPAQPAVAGGVHPGHRRHGGRHQPRPLLPGQDRHRDP